MTWNKIALIGAMNEEIELLVSHMTDVRETNKAGITFRKVLFWQGCCRMPDRCWESECCCDYANFN